MAVKQVEISRNDKWTIWKNCWMTGKWVEMAGKLVKTTSEQNETIRNGW